MTVFSLSTVRTLALSTQGLTRANHKPADPIPENLASMVVQLGAVQLDTLQMVQRSHRLIPWSRFGTYTPEDFERLIYDPVQRRLFEGWMHAACILPIEEYRFQRVHQKKAIEEGSSWFGRWLHQDGNRQILEEVRNRLHQKGAQKAQDFQYNGPKRGSWWDWKPAKVALEYLHTYGEVMIADRKNFQRVYDLTERVLPDWIDKTEPSLVERNRHWVEIGARALGICKADQTGDYSHRKKNDVKPVIQDLLDEGILLPIQARLADGEVYELVIHRDNQVLLEQIADGEIKAERTTFLSPFDSLFWARRRDLEIWNFRQVLEAYKPAVQREWGYFCLPILHGERLVGRFDPKLERKTGLLRLKTIYLEPEVVVSDELVAGIAQALRDFLEFHHATDLIVEQSVPESFRHRLQVVWLDVQHNQTPSAQI